MESLSSQAILTIADAVEALFTERDLMRLGYLTGSQDYINNHPRLLRSLHFGDDDFSVNVLEYISKLIQSQESRIIVLEYNGVEDWIKENGGKYYEEIYSEIKSIQAQNVPTGLVATQPNSQISVNDSEIHIELGNPPTQIQNSIRVFISYTHDSDIHSASVVSLAQRLRRDGIDARMDRFEPNPKEGWPRWMANQIKDAHYVIVVCTETYKRRSEGHEEKHKGLGGNWEGLAITQEIYDDQGANSKFIPIFLNESDSGHIPSFLRAYTRYHIYKDNDYDGLYRYLTGQPEIVPEELGVLKMMPPLASAPLESGIRQTGDVISLEKVPGLKVLVTDEEGSPIASVSVVLLYNNGTHIYSTTDASGTVYFDKTIERKSSLLVAHPNGSSYLREFNSPKGSVKIEMSINRGIGSIIIDKSGYIPNLLSRLSPIKDSQGRTYIYGDNISFDDQADQPFCFELEKNSLPRILRETYFL